MGSESLVNQFTNDCNGCFLVSFGSLHLIPQAIIKVVHDNRPFLDVGFK